MGWNNEGWDIVNPPSLKANFGWYNVVTDYSADPTGTNECSTQILAAIAAAKVNGGTVYFPPSPTGPGIYLVSATIACILNGTTDRMVRLWGAGAAMQSNGIVGNKPATTFKWVGAAGGTVMSVGFGTVACGEFNIDCNNGLADIGLLMTDIQQAHWGHVIAFDANVWNYKIVAAAAGVYGNTFEKLQNFSVVGGAGGGCLFEGTNSSYDVAVNTFVDAGFVTNGANAALDIRSADTNLFGRLSVGRAAGGVSAGANALYFGAASGQRLGALTSYIAELDGGGPIVHDSTSRNVIGFINYSNGLATPTGANPDKLMLLSSSSGDVKLGNNTAVVLVIGSAGGAFSQPTLGFIVRDTTRPGYRLEKTGVIGYESYIGTDNQHHLSGTGLAANVNGQFNLVGGVTTQGNGVPVLTQAPAVLTAQIAAVASVATKTSPNDANKHRYRVSGHITITVHGTESINLQVTYTDDNGTARTLTIPIFTDSGAMATAANAAGEWTGSAVISVNPNTVITLKTAGTFTGATYNVGGLIEAMD